MQCTLYSNRIIIIIIDEVDLNLFERVNACYKLNYQAVNFLSSDIEMNDVNIQVFYNVKYTSLH